MSTLAVVGQKRLIIDKYNDIEIIPGESTIYYDVLFQKNDSILQVFWDQDEAYSINDTIIVDVEYDKDNKLYEVKWYLKQNQQIIQRGTFNKKGNAHGKFEAFLYYEIAYCHFMDGVKEGLQVFKRDMFTNVNSFSDNKLHGVSYVLQDDFLLKYIAHYYKGELDGTLEGYWTNENVLIPHFKDEYKSGKIEDGTSIIYHPSGEIFMTIEYENGIQHGWEITYDTDGKVFKKRKFYKGEPLSPEEW